jgi:hypothetical protein
MPRYAYGEEIAVLVEKLDDRLSLRRSYQTFAKKLTEGRSPWEGEVEKPNTFSRFSSVGPKLSDSLLDTVSLSRATRLGRSLIIMFLIVGALAASFLAFYQFRKAQQVQLARQQLSFELAASKNENRESEERIKQLENNSAVIAENEANRVRIEELTKQLTASKEETQTQTDLAVKAKLQADRASQANEQMNTTLQLYKSDLEQSQNAYNEAFRKYSASQTEVRRLQDRIANCACRE